MAWLPISWTVPQYLDSNGDPYSGAVLKFYQDGTTTNTNMSTDNSGGTQLADVVLDSNGYPSNGGSIFIPHIDQAFKLSLYPTEAAADADTGAIWTIDNLTPADLADTDTDELAKVSSNDTTAGYLNGKLVVGNGLTLTENSDGGNETLTISADSVSTTATNHIRAGNFQIIDGSTTITAYQLDTILTAGAGFQTFGPGGSGAANIMNELDDMPSRARIVMFDVAIGFVPSSATGGSCFVYATEGNVSASETNGNLIIDFRIDNDTTTGTFHHYMTRCYIPLASDNLDFKVSYTEANGSVSRLDFYYRGFITD